MADLQNVSFLKVTLKDSTLEPMYISVNDSVLIDTIFEEVREKLCERSALIPGELELLYRANEKEVTLSTLKDKSLSEAELWPLASNHELIIFEKNITLDVSDVEDELHLGASASPTADAEAQEDDEAHEEQKQTYVYNKTKRRVAAIEPSPVVVHQSENNNFVGLVNQAMTCYLNSLLQALYMTPEFRNALYNWEFDGASETRSIPYQLQKLFLNLQTSGKSAVETTDLTTSFGWQGSDAWHQHDIQELCRVMFDALEHKFKDTKQANLINDLYEGKMIDYVKCLECSTEKTREDTFLDIPLPVRPFGSTVAYNSVEEALRAFVQPETLDGNNQYFCEKCDKKCDAHKGLKFIKFPYLLTLHLKRFDFDYSSMHRIKLNDKVVFPERLDLNSFVPVKKDADHGNDDCSTTDSGSADDESCQGTDLSSTVNGQDDNCADSDEGIDVSSGTAHHGAEPKGPYTYELFSIMIHSGSASGGHYYAYIKDFEKNAWFCFNDQNVTSITEDDIMKTYGGGPQRAYYSGAYSSSTNAYMLMYRQIDKDRNCRAMSVSEFPAHIQKLLNNVRRKEEEERINRKKENDMVKVDVWCLHPLTKTLQELKISTFADSTLAEVAQHAYNRFKLDGLVEVTDCRMVTYNKHYECIDFSFDSDEITCQQVEAKYDSSVYKWMLEIREPGTEWKRYKEGGINVKVYFIHLDTLDIEQPRTVRLDVDETVGELKRDLSVLLNITDPKVILSNYNAEHKYLSDDSEIVEFDSKWEYYKLYVTNAEDERNVLHSFQDAVGLYSHIISLDVVLPETDEATLEALSIPSLDLNQNLDKHDDRGAVGMNGDGYDQSNSEDSSLSDSDRTLIGDPPVDCLLESTGDQHMASPTDACQDGYNNYDILCKQGEDNMVWEQAGDAAQNEQPRDYYFKVTEVRRGASSFLCKVLMDKRMNLETLKKHLECLMKVPSEYFKVFVQNVEFDWSRLKDPMKSLSDGERITLKLGRVLMEDEQVCKIYHLKPDSLDPNVLLFEHIVTKYQTIEATKKELLKHSKNQGVLDLPYSRCRLREKLWKKPKKVFLDDQKFGEEISFPSNLEIYLQELTEPETVTSSNQVVVFTRQFCPEKLSLEPHREIVLNLLTMEELRKKISELSDISLEHLDVAHVKGNYPYEMHLLEIEDELDWNPKFENLGQWPLSVDDGSMFFYRDNRQKVSLTPEETKEIRHREDVRLGRLAARTFSPGRERALKIYLLDNSPSKSQDDID